MQAQIMTDMFQYEPCELEVSDGALCVTIAGTARRVEADSLSSAALTRQKNGKCRLELSAGSERYEFLLQDGQTGDEAQKLLYELTKNDERLEMRMRSE